MEVVRICAGDVELLGLDSEPYLHNSAYGTVPLVIHGNGPSKVSFAAPLKIKLQVYMDWWACSQAWRSPIPASAHASYCMLNEERTHPQKEG